MVAARREGRSAVAATPRIASTSALLFATAPAADGGPAAALALPEGTLLGRLLGQLRSLGVRRVSVVTRPAYVDAVRAAAEGAPMAVEVVPSEDLAEDMRATAEVAARARGQLLVARGEALAHREALAGLLADPRIISGILTTGSARMARWAFRTRTARGRVVSAGSPWHRVGDPTGFFLGFIKVDPRDSERLVAAAERAAALLRDGPPEAWELELERKEGDWRREAWSAAERERTGLRPERAERPDPDELELTPEGEARVALRARAAQEDSVSLLLVALVRGGAQLTVSHLRGFYVARPLSGAAVGEALEEMAGYDEDKVALASAVKSTDGFFTTYFVSPYSRYIARFAARRGWTPNQMTTLSMAIGLVASAAFAVGSRPGLIAGAVLLQAAFTIDCVDGQLARYTRTFSKLGAWLDSVFDRGKEYVVYAGLAIGSINGFGRDVWVLAGAALTLQTVRHASTFSFTATRHQAIAATPQRPLEDPGDDRIRAWSGRPARIDEDAALPAPQANGGRSRGRPATGAGRAEAVHGDADGAAVVTRVPDLVGAPAEALEDAGAAEDARPRPRPSLPVRAMRLVASVDRFRWAVWLKRVVVLPIGERFALISITAALFTPHVTFVALLAWGGFAALYSVTGMVLRSLAAK